MPLSALDRLLYRSLLPLCVRLDAQRQLRVLLSNLKPDDDADAPHALSAHPGYAWVRQLTGGRSGWYLPHGGGSPAVVDGVVQAPSAVALLRVAYRGQLHPQQQTAASQDAGLFLLRLLRERFEWGKATGLLPADEPLHRLPAGFARTPRAAFLRARDLPLPDGRAQAVADPSGVTSGMLLVSHPFLTPPFQRSVILLLEHTPPPPPSAPASDGGDPPPTTFGRGGPGRQRRQSAYARSGYAGPPPLSGPAPAGTLGVVINAPAPLCTLQQAARDFLLDGSVPGGPGSNARHNRRQAAASLGDAGTGAGDDDGGAAAAPAGGTLGGAGGPSGGGGSAASTQPLAHDSPPAARRRAGPAAATGSLCDALSTDAPPLLPLPSSWGSLGSVEGGAADGADASDAIAEEDAHTATVGRSRSRARRSTAAGGPDGAGVLEAGAAAAAESLTSVGRGRGRAHLGGGKSSGAGSSFWRRSLPQPSLRYAGNLPPLPSAASSLASSFDGGVRFRRGRRPPPPRVGMPTWGVSVGGRDALGTAAGSADDAVGATTPPPAANVAADAAPSAAVTATDSHGLAAHLPPYLGLPFAVTAPADLGPGPLAEMFPPPSPAALARRAVVDRWAHPSGRDARRRRVVPLDAAPLRPPPPVVPVPPPLPQQFLDNPASLLPAAQEQAAAKPSAATVTPALLAWPFLRGDRLTLRYDTSDAASAGDGTADDADGTVIRDAVLPAWLEDGAARMMEAEGDEDGDEEGLSAAAADADDDYDGTGSGGGADHEDSGYLHPGSSGGRAVVRRGSRFGHRRTRVTPLPTLPPPEGTTWCRGWPLLDGHALPSAAAAMGGGRGDASLRDLAALVSDGHASDDGGDDDGLVAFGARPRDDDDDSNNGYDSDLVANDDSDAEDDDASGGSSAPSSIGGSGSGAGSARREWLAPFFPPPGHAAAGGGAGAPLLVRFQSPRFGGGDGSGFTAMLYPADLREMARIVRRAARRLEQREQQAKKPAAAAVGAPGAATHKALPPPSTGSTVAPSVHADSSDDDEDFGRAHEDSDDEDEDDDGGGVGGGRSADDFHLSVQLVRLPPAPAQAGGGDCFSLVYSYELEARHSGGEARRDGRGHRSGSADSPPPQQQQHAGSGGVIAIEVPLAAQPPTAPRDIRVHMLGAARGLPPHMARAATQAALRLWAAHAAAHAEAVNGGAPTVSTSVGGAARTDAATAGAAAAVGGDAAAPLSSASQSDGASAGAAGGASPSPPNPLDTLGRDKPVWEGGPVPGFAMALTARSEVSDTAWQVACPMPAEAGEGAAAADSSGGRPTSQPPLWVTRSLAGPARLASLGLGRSGDFLLLRNASLWGGGQLAAELASGAWVAVRHADVAGLVAAQAARPAGAAAANGGDSGGGGEAMWRAVMASLGGEYAAALAATPNDVLGGLPRHPDDML